MKFILHVGVHKTGTTAIQQAFSGYDDGTLAYADLGSPNHTLPFATLFSDTLNDYWSGMGEPVESVRQRFLDRPDAALTKRPPVILFSGEGISLLPVDSLRRMRAHLAQHCSSFQVVLFARDPSKWTASAIQEGAKHGAKGPGLSGLVNFATRHRALSKVFSKDEMTVRKYEDAGGDMLGYFSTLVGADRALVTPSEKGHNRSMTLEAMRVLHIYNSLSIRLWRGETVEAAHWRFVFSVISIFDDGKPVEPWHVRKAVDTGDYTYLEREVGVIYDRPPEDDRLFNEAAADPWILDRLNYFLTRTSLPASTDMGVAISSLYAYCVAVELAGRGALAEASPPPPEPDPVAPQMVPPEPDPTPQPETAPTGKGGLFLQRLLGRMPFATQARRQDTAAPLPSDQPGKRS